MTIEIIFGRRVLSASKGMVITDGEDVYGKKIILEINRTNDEFKEICESEVKDGISEEFYS